MRLAGVVIGSQGVAGWRAGWDPPSWRISTARTLSKHKNDSLADFLETIADLPLVYNGFECGPSRFLPEASDRSC
jgi:hypothetical protein